MADDHALLKGPFGHLAGSSRGRTQAIAPYQPHGFTQLKAFRQKRACSSVTGGSVPLMGPSVPPMGASVPRTGLFNCFRVVFVKVSGCL